MENVHIPNFCALDLFTSKQFFKNNLNLCKDFKHIIETAITIFSNDLDYTLYAYYSETKQEKTDLMDEIIKDTINRFISPFDNSEKKWKNLYDYTVKNQISNITDSQYSDMFAS